MRTQTRTRETTTDLATLREDPVRFPWGEILQFINCGPYTLALYYPRKVRGFAALQDIDYTASAYHIWIDGKDGCCGATSLDEALARAIAYRREGPNSRAAEYFMRMLPEKQEAAA